MLQIEVLKMKQWLKSFVHNCVVHPAIPFLPVKVANWLHDKNANWAFGLERYDEVGLEGKKKRIIRLDERNIVNGEILFKIIDDALQQKQ